MQTGKPVLILLGIQTALIVFLIARVYGVEARTGELAADISTISTDKKPEVRDLNPSSPMSNGITSAGALSADQTRLIVREELELLSENLMETIEKRSAGARQSGKPAVTMDPEEVERLRATVTDQINNLSAQGTASRAEVAILEQNIARLPPGEREKALGQFFKAINQGKIDTRL